MGLLHRLAILNPVPWAGRLLDFCYPGVCPCCQQDCDGAGPLCPDCLDRLAALEDAPACERCARPVAQAGAPCPYCRGKGLYPFGRIARLGLYREPLRELIHQLKYQRRWAIGEFLAERLAARPAAGQILALAHRLVPVPLHWLRQFHRGYNQSDLIARRIAALASARACRPIVRLRDTESQTRLPATRRHENVRGAFALESPGRLAGKHVVVVDDVMTSAATLQEVGRAILPAKPASLSALVIAVADPHHSDFTRI